MRHRIFAIVVWLAPLATCCVGCQKEVSPPPASSSGDSPVDRSATAPGAAANGDGANAEAAPDRPAGVAEDDAHGQAAAGEGAQGAPQSLADAAADAAPRDEALFEGWPKPQALLVISGEQDGYMEPCGCAGKEVMKGGLSRRHTFLSELRQRGWETITLDLGNQVRRTGKQSEIKFHSVIDGLGIMQYEAIGYGPNDLRLFELITDAKSGFVSANVGLLGLPGIETPQYHVVERGGRKVGITAIVGDTYHHRIINPDVTLLPAAEGLKQVVPKLQQENCDLLVLLSHAPPKESLALARQFPQFHVVVTAEGHEEPPFQPQQVPDTETWLVELGHKAAFVVAIGLFDDPRTPLRFQRVPLDVRFADSPEMVRLMAAYQDRLKDAGLVGLQIDPEPHASGHEFVGSDKCGECHTQAFAVWKVTTHSTALDTLEQLQPPRDFDPECLSCHVTGWDPQRYVPFASGYLSRQATPLLAHNGCENCHGPGSAHVAAEEEAADEPLIQELRAAMRADYAQADESCRQCHDLDNSPAFEFETYWPQVEHRGKD